MIHRSELNPHTRIAYSYAADQEAYRKDIKRGFCILKIKFLASTHPINLHHHDDIKYLVLAAIRQHNMMVEARLMSGEGESAAMYNTVQTTAAESQNVDAEATVMEEEDCKEKQEQGIDNKLRFEIAYKMWAELYDHEGAAKLKSAMMGHLYKQKFGQRDMSHAYDSCEEYDPPSY